MVPPLVVDIDGTMSGADRAIEGRVIDALGDWGAPVVVATGKAFPYPVALCQFVGLETRAIAENGGVVCTEGGVTFNGDPEAASRARAALREQGHGTGWDEPDLVNRWRETELAIERGVPREPLAAVAADHGLELVDTGFAYHLKPPDIDKGTGLRTVAAELGRDPAAFAAVGDSENDVSTFGAAGESYAVANADGAARAAADVVTEGAYADGLLEALDAIR